VERRLGYHQTSADDSHSRAPSEDKGYEDALPGLLAVVVPEEVLVSWCNLGDCNGLVEADKR
jgi:hypothetical protein